MTAIIPWMFQDDIVNQARLKLSTCQSCLIQSPTGSGKTTIGSMIAAGAMRKGKRIMFTVHRDFLVDQTIEAFNNWGIPYSLIVSGYTPDYGAPAQIASIDTLRHRLDKVRHADLVVVDEAKHSLAPSWLKTLRHFMAKGTKVIGLDATPWRMSGAGLGEVYESMVCGPPVRWLIENGYLADYKAYAPFTPDLSGIHIKQGDYDKHELAERLDTPSICGDAIIHYKRYAMGKRAAAFCVSIMHSEHVAASFNDAGIPAAHLDGTMDRDQRRRILDSLRSGKIKVMCSVEVCGEGLDIKELDAVILLRPTQSLALHFQQIGRALRKCPGKDRAVILDHANNLRSLGLPDEPIEWSLDGDIERKKRQAEKSLPVRQCPACYRCHRPAPVCPECGHVYITEGRSVKQIEGELTEVSEIESFRRKAELHREVQQAKTLGELMAIGKARGYKSPLYWAKHVLNGRQAKQRASA